MATAAFILALAVAILHFGFLYMETLGWPKMVRGFGMSKEDVVTTKPLALNQGFYNGGLTSVLR